MKKTILLIVLALILNSTFIIHNSEAQWEQCDSIYDGIVFSLAISGNTIFAGTNDSGVYLSTNNGQNWTQSALNNKDVYCFAINGNNIFAGTNNGVWLSTNNGQTWIQTGLNHTINFSLAISGNNIFTGCYNNQGVLFSINNGQTWTHTSLNNKDVYSLAINENIIFAGTYYSGIYFSTNNGRTWTQTSLTNSVVRSLAISGNNIFAGTYNFSSPSGVYLSTNNGQTWTQTALNNQHVPSLVISGNNIFAGTGSGVFHSTNNGSTWLNKNQGFSVVPRVNSLLIANGYIFAGTEGYSVWRRSYSEIIGIKQISELVPSSYSLSQNYPNPFNPVSKIQYELPRAGVVRLAVYDVMGREIEMLVNERQAAGSYETVWDGTRFASGVYFYRLTAEGYRETRKMLLIR
ncbi:MAG: T9SS type A sorting domain-containing protein [Ignavibacteriae bacterium]|nr:T9SS type A sorting domain-containing protein [Ignavibacteriota bacterium]